jgi:hypothetical protein
MSNCIIVRNLFKFDINAQAFIDSYGIINSTEILAINTLVKSMKKGIINGTDSWTPGVAVYPISQTSLAASYGNLINPLTYELSVGVAPTHSSTGLLFNGSTMYLKTGVNAQSDLGINNNSIGVYNGFDKGGAFKTSIGARDAFGHIRVFEDGVNIGTTINSAVTGVLTAVDTASGWVMGNKSAPAALQLYKNDSEVANGGSGDANPPQAEIYIGAGNGNGTAEDFTDNEIRFAYLGTSLSALQNADLYAAIQAYQTSLGRNV